LGWFEENDGYVSWGRSHRFKHRVAKPAHADRLAELMAADQGDSSSLLAFGKGRSYGDSCLNRDGRLIDTSGLDRFIGFDRENGLLEAEAGVSLADVLRLLTGNGVACSWFLPVTPGTKFVSLGGAVANDVHGKNHHGAGCFGEHVESLTLLRSNGELLRCSLTENADLFRATLGGLGLTGLIVSVALRLKRATGPWMECEDVRYDTLDAFFQLTEESLGAWEYTVAWIDCLARGPRLGRGIFSRARHAVTAPDAVIRAAALEPRLRTPADFPNFALNNLTIRAFNGLYWRKAPYAPVRRIAHFDPVFYPLDAIGGWNRMYGSRGFYQYQCAVPTAVAKDAVRELLTVIASAGQGSFLAVLKTLGDRPSPGMMSFPMPGATLALDFPNNGAVTHALLDRLDEIVTAAGGRIYPAKDGRASPWAFQAGYPQLEAFSRFVDPGFSSSFWRRVGAGRQGAGAS
jgi:FAD/FMN-containing dehydrogenase